MNNTKYVHWDENDSQVCIDLDLEKPMKVIADMFDSNGRRIINVFDKHCLQGKLNTSKKISKLPSGIYIMKISSDEGLDTIRFKVH